jgi:RimJ/RimL family protein N-acetyltransferase
MEKRSPPSKIQLSATLLKKRNVKDAQTGFECIDSDRERLRKFLPWVDATKIVDDQIWYINECIKDWKDGTRFDFAMFNLEQEYIGSFGIHNIQWQNHCCEFGYWLHGKHEGCGYISAAVQAVEKILFDWGFNRIEIRCDPQNQKSAAVPKRNNYYFEGIFRQETLFRDQYRDTAVYSKLKADLKR